MYFASRHREITYIKVTGTAGSDDLASGPMYLAVSSLSPRRFKSCTGLHIQFGVLNSQATSSSATTINKDPLVALALAGERQTKFLVECHAHGNEANASGGSLLRGEAVRNLVRGAFLDHSVLSEAAAVEIVGIGAVCHASNSVACLVLLGNFRSDFNDSATKIAADGRACRWQVVDVLPELLSVTFSCSLGIFTACQSVGFNATAFTLTRTRSSRSSGLETSWISALPADTILTAFILTCDWVILLIGLQLVFGGNNVLKEERLR
jgi:hypothetical protein